MSGARKKVWHTAADERWSKFFFVGSLLLVLLALLLRLPGLERGIWYDELSSLALAHGKNFLQASRAYDHPPLYFLILRGWLFVSDSIVWLRILSVFFAVIGLLFFILWVRLFSERAALVAGLLYCCSPGLLSFSQEIRQYSLLVCLVLGAVYLQERFLRAATPHRWLLVGFAVLLSLAVSTHLIAVFLLPGLYVYCYAFDTAQTGEEGNQHIAYRKRLLFVASIPTVLLFIIWHYFYLASHTHSHANGWWIPGPSWQMVTSTFVELLGFPQVVEGVMILPAYLHLPALALVFILIATLVWALTFARWRAGWGSFILFIVPYLTIVCYSAFFTSVLVSRTVLFLVPFLLATISLLVSSIKETRTFLLTGGILLIFATMGTSRWVFWESQRERNPWSAVSDFLQKEIAQDPSQAYGFVTHPSHVFDMLYHRAGEQFKNKVLALDEESCRSLEAVSVLYYIYHERKFMPQSHLARHRTIVDRMATCQYTSSVRFSKGGIHIFKFLSTKDE